MRVEVPVVAVNGQRFADVQVLGDISAAIAARVYTEADTIEFDGVSLNSQINYLLQTAVDDVRITGVAGITAADFIGAGCLGLIGQIGRNRDLFALPVAVRCIGERLHREEVDDAGEVLLRTDRQVDRERRPSEHLVNALDGPLKIGAFPVESVDEERVRHVEFVGEAVDLLGHHFHTGDAVDRYVDVWSPERGLRIQVATSNARAIGTDPTVVLAEPPLTAAELRTIALDRVWGPTIPQRYVAAGQELPSYNG